MIRPCYVIASILIARALITKPAIILADEPTGNLDSKTSADVLGLLKRTSMEFNQTIVMITHNNEIAQLAGRIVRIEDRRIFLKCQSALCFSEYFYISPVNPTRLKGWKRPCRQRAQS